MTDRVADALLKRARRELEFASFAITGGYPEQATSRAYYAAFYAASAALASVGVSRSKHSAVLAAFGEKVIKGGGLDPAVGASLRELFNLRIAADYTWLDVPRGSAAEDAVAPARPFVDAVAVWIADRRT